MAVDIKQVRSRRAMLAGLAGAAGAFAASALGRPLPTRAGTDGDVVLGASNTTTTLTKILNTDTTGSAFQVHSGSSANDAGPGIGIMATSEVDTAFAILGQGAESATSNSVGVYATGDWGVIGLGNGAGVLGSGFAGETGVFGTPSQTSLVPPANCGVVGQADAGGTAVVGFTGQIVPTPTPNAAMYARADEGGGFAVGIVAWCDGGIGMLAHSEIGVGVYGSASSSTAIPSNFAKAGVAGQADAGATGVVGYTGATPPTPTPDTGIYGRSDTGGAGGRGLMGHCAAGIGLLGETISGVGVRAYCANNTGVGLRVTGKAAFDRSGKLSIGAGHSSLTKSGIGLTSASFILATLQTNVAGLFIQAVVTNPSGSSFTVYLNKAPSVNVAVAWMAVN